MKPNILDTIQDAVQIFTSSPKNKGSESPENFLVSGKESWYF